MALENIVDHLYQVSLGIVNAFLIDGDELTLVDTGVPGSAPAILSAIQTLGRQPTDLKHILLTHLHADHTGSVKAIQAATGAKTHMHPLDAQAFQQGIIMRPVSPGPGMVNAMLSRMMKRMGPMSVEPVTIDAALEDRQTLPFAGGLEVLYTPGHTIGHVALLWPAGGGVLIAGDACGNMMGLGYAPIYEDLAQGKRTLAALSQHSFQTAVFGHGKPVQNARAAFHKKWASN